MRNVFEAMKQYDAAFEGWFKNILGISTGALALLVALMPKESPPAPDKYFLGICWLSFVLCILCSLLASLRPVILARVNVRVQQALLDKPSDQCEFQIKSGVISPTVQMKLIGLAQVLAIFSFCASFISLAVYAFLQTF